MPRAVTGLVLAAMMTIPSIVSAQTNTPSAVQMLQGTRLDIVATGETRHTPDIAVISAGVVSQSENAATAMKENAVRMSAVIAALKKAGIADKDITTSTINLNPQYRYGENVPPVITGYQGTNTVTVRFRDIAKSGTILDALVTQGANQISGPNLQIDKPQAAEDEARVNAVRTATQRATLYAQAAGMKVKRIILISETGGYSPSQPVYMSARAFKAGTAADTEIQAGEQTVGITVTVSFELE